MLDQDVRVRTVEDRVEAAHRRGVRQRFEHRDLAAEVAQRLLVLNLIGPQAFATARAKRASSQTRQAS